MKFLVSSMGSGDTSVGSQARQAYGSRSQLFIAPLREIGRADRGGRGVVSQFMVRMSWGWGCGPGSFSEGGGGWAHWSFVSRTELKRRFCVMRCPPAKPSFTFTAARAAVNMTLLRSVVFALTPW